MRYGNFRYGDGTKYGQAPFDTQLWGLLVDWDGDGVYDYINEAIHMTRLKTSRGRRYMLNASGTGYERVEVGTLVIELDNTSGRFNPYNMDSPLYPYVRPGVKVTIVTRLPETGEQYSVFTGSIDDIVPLTANYDRVSITATDGLKWLSEPEINLHIQSNKSLNTLINTILTTAGWPWGINLETSTDVIPYFWAPTGVKVLALINDLATSYLGMFFVGADGSARFYSRNHDLSTTTMRIEQDQMSVDIMTRSPWEVVKNQISVVSHPLTGQSLTILWSLYDKPSIGLGTTFEVWGNFQVNGAEVPITGYQSPVASTDYLVNTAADGSGTDLTGACTVNVTVYANKVLYKVTNNSASNGYITLLQLRGDPLVSSPVSTILEDADSKALYGPKSMTIESLFLQNSNLISDIASAMMMLLKDPQIYPTIKVTSRPEIQYTLDLFDLVDLVIDHFWIGDTYRLGYIEHEWLSENGQSTVSTFGFEPVINDLGIIWQFTAQIGIDTKFAF
ncbi:MAG: hypothetical protein ACYC3H_01425 [Bellilinea sp.]